MNEKIHLKREQDEAISGMSTMNLLNIQPPTDDEMKSGNENIEMSEMVPHFNFDDILSMSDRAIQQHRDDRGFTLLMLASEAGRLDIVQNLIDRGEDVDAEVEGENAANLAFAKVHHEIFLTLLKANAKFPQNFQQNSASPEIKELVDLSTKMHDKINETNQENLEEVKAILKSRTEAFPSMQYFYDVNNNSILKQAILSRKFSLYKFLLSLNIFLAPHESMDEINESLSDEDRRMLSKINLKLSPNLLTEPMMILMRNCKLSPDSPRDREAEFTYFIRQAFDNLFAIPAIAIILRIVAASRNFKIIFDFKRDSVTFLDPKAEPYCEGLMYLSGKIYIGAKDLLNSETAYRVISTIAHELTHYAMCLVYGNWAKPYKKSDKENESRFAQIQTECERVKNCEEIVELVYDCYEEDMQHAELIVRVPHMIAFYFNNLDVLNNLRRIYRSLFEFYEQVCVSEMEKELPKIEEKFSPTKKLKNQIKKHKWFNFTLVVLIMLSLSLGGIWAYILYDPLVPWSELRSSRKLELKSRQVDFQGQNVTIGELLKNDESFELLKPLQIRQIRHTNSFKISSALEEKNKIYIERYFADESIEIASEKKFAFRGSISQFYYDGEIDLQNVNLVSFDKIVKQLSLSKIFLLSSAAGDGKSTVFRHFTSKIKKHFPYKWIQFVDLKKHIKVIDEIQRATFKRDNLFVNFEKILNLRDFDLEVFKVLFTSNDVIFLWDGVDEIAPRFTTFVFDLIEKVSQTKNFQFVSTRPQLSKSFREKFGIKAYKLIPFSERDRFEFLVKTIALKFEENDDDEFFEKHKRHFRNLNLIKGYNKYVNIIRKANQIFNFSESSSEDNFVSNPLLVSMISEDSIDDNFKIENSTFNSFRLYETFITQKLKIIHEKGEVVQADTDQVHSLSIWQVHQFFALKLLMSSIDLTENYLEITKNYLQDKIENHSLKVFSPAQISRFGILQVDSENDFTFAHRTFAEFFTTQFYLNNVLTRADQLKTADNWKIISFLELLTGPKLFSFIQDALREKFKMQTSLTYISSLIEKAYLNNASSVLNISMNIQKWPSYQFKIIAFYTLYTKVKLSNFERFQMTIFINQIIVPEALNNIEKEASDKLEILRSDLMTYKKGYETQIINGDYEMIILWIKEINLPKNIIRQFIPELIKSGYAKSSKNFVELHEFILNLPAEIRSIGLLSLYDEIKAQISYDDYSKVIAQAFEKNATDLNNLEFSLPYIVTFAYSHDSDHFKIILELIRSFSNLEQSMIGLMVLYNAMDLKDRLESCQLLVFDDEVTKIIENSNFSNIKRKKDFEILKGILNKNSRKSFEDCGAQIRMGKNEYVVSYIERISKSQNIFELDLPDIVLFSYGFKNVYSNLSEQYKNKFKYLKNELEVKGREGVKELGAEIRKGYIVKIINWIKNFEGFVLALPDIIKSAYSNNLNNFESVMTFIINLPNSMQSAISLLTLYDEMKANNHLESFQLVAFAYSIEEVIKMKDFSHLDQEIKNKLKYVKGELEEKLKETIKEVGAEIRKGNYEKIILWAKNFNINGGSIKLALPDLIKAAYSGNRSNFEKVNKFLEDLPYVWYKYFCFPIERFI